MSNVTNRIQSIDLLKIMAMFGVVGLHCIKWSHSDFCFFIHALFGISIPLFFTVSGYLTIDKDGGYKYARRKVYGIIKFVTIIAFAKWIVSKLFFGEDSGPLWRSMTDPYIQRGMLYTIWYFGAMIIIYLLQPLLHSLFTRHDKHIGIIVACMVCIETIVFVLNVTKHFEYGIIQTFRVWNWLTYYLLGAYIKKRKVSGRKYIPLLAVIAVLGDILFKSATWEHLNGVEYYFCSIPTMIAAALVFIAFCNLRIEGSIFINELSRVYIPVFTLHVMIQMAWHHLLGDINPFADYALVLATSIILGLIIVRIPIVSDIFKI